MPFVLGSGITSSAGEQCVITGTAGLGFTWNLVWKHFAAVDKEGFSCMSRLFVIAWAGGTCVTLADGDT